MDVVPAQLPPADNGVAAIGKRAGKPLRESRSVPRDSPVVAGADLEDSEHAARVEVMLFNCGLPGVAGSASGPSPMRSYSVNPMIAIEPGKSG